MKTLVIYSSKHGTTKSIAEHIACELEGDAVALKHIEPSMLEHAETIIIGTATYAGRPHGPVKKFCDKYQAILCKKRLGLFISGLKQDAEARPLVLNAAFPKNLQEHASATAFVGGAIKFDSLNFLEKTITKKILMSDKDIDKVDHSAIDTFIKTLS